MFPPVDPRLLAVIVLTAAAPTGAVPTFNVVSHCRAVAAAVKPLGDPAVCLRAEQRARAQLVQEWRQFTGAEKSYCFSLSAMNSEPIYTELLTCLEVARDARLLRQKERDTVGVGK
jgi:hypothetical protein